MNKVIEYYKKSNYGTESMYIKNVNIALSVGALTKKATISNSDIKALEALGFEFKEVIK